jgi:hypothetical protein
METAGTHRAVLRAFVAIGMFSGLATMSVATLPRAEAKEIEFPESGTPVERGKKLWQETRTHVLADAKAALSDAEYQKRRVPIWGAWTRLQMSIAGEDDQVSRIIPDVLGLLNDTYGWTAFPAAQRQEIRDRKRKYTEQHVAEFDQRFAALK